MSLPPRSTPLPVVTANLAGKNVLITGANTGIGFEASKHFASMQPDKLILACRNKAKGLAALEKLQTETGYTKAEVWILDLADFASVSAFADKVESELSCLDIVVQNAGIITWGYFPTDDGWETMLKVNYISQALLAMRLLPVLAKTAKQNPWTPRLVIVTSSMALAVKWDETHVGSSGGFLAMLNKREYVPDSEIAFKRYPETKLLDMFLTRSLHTHVGSSIIVDCVCPNLCESDLTRDFPSAVNESMVPMREISGYTSEEGSRQLVYAAIGEAKNEDILRGVWIQDNAVSSYPEFMSSKTGVALEEKLWHETLCELERVDLKVKEIRDVYLK